MTTMTPYGVIGWEGVNTRWLPETVATETRATVHGFTYRMHILVRLQTVPGPVCNRIQSISVAFENSVAYEIYGMRTQSHISIPAIC